MSPLRRSPPAINPSKLVASAPCVVIEMTLAPAFGATARAAPMMVAGVLTVAFTDD
jgi:hypothetical protein